MLIRVVIELLRRPLKGVEIEDLGLLFYIGKSIEFGGAGQFEEMEVTRDEAGVKGDVELLESYDDFVF